MDENIDDSVKIYFINPIDTLTVIIGTLIELQYEAYSINISDKEKLLSIFHENFRNVVFICIRSKEEIDSWFDYIKKIKELSYVNVLIGSFVYDKMEMYIKNKFLIENVAMIEFSDIAKNTLQIMKKLLFFFEAKTKKTFVRARAYGTSEIYFYFKNMNEPIKGKILIISAYAFSCQIEPLNIKFFQVGAYLDDILLVLNGIRVKTSLKIIGFSKENPYIIMFKYANKANNFSDNIFDGYEETISHDIKKKIYEYIRWCLKEDLSIRLRDIKQT